MGDDGKAPWFVLATGAIGPITTSAPGQRRAWHHVVLSGAGNTQTLYLDGDAVGTKSGVLNHLSMKENYVGYGWTGGWPSAPSSGASYFSGTVDEVAFYTRPLGLPAVRQQYTSRTGTTSLLSKVTLPSGKVQATVSYDGNLDRVQQVTDSGGGVWKVQEPVVTGSSAGYRSAIVNSAPRDYWRLGESAGASVAVSEIADPDRVHDGTYTAATLGAEGTFAAKDNTAVTLNGTSSQVRLPEATLHSAPADATVELWFKTKKPGAILSELTKPVGTTPTNWVPVLYVGADGKLRGQFWDGQATPITSTGAVNDDKWHHAALVSAGTTQTLYLDGASIGTNSGTVTHLSMTENYLGYGWTQGWPSAPSAGASYFTGSIDEVAVYHRALTAAQVDQHFDARGDAQTATPMRTASVIDPGGKTISSVYDAHNGGRPVASVDARGKMVTYGYDTGGYLNTVADANQHVTTLGHDSRGNEISRTTCRAATSCQTTYTSYYLNTANSVDPRNDQVTERRDARSASATDNTYRTTYTYTATGEVASVTGPPTPDFPSGRATASTYTTGSEAAVGGGATPGWAARIRHGSPWRQVDLRVPQHGRPRAHHRPGWPGDHVHLRRPRPRHEPHRGFGLVPGRADHHDGLRRHVPSDADHCAADDQRHHRHEAHAERSPPLRRGRQPDPRRGRRHHRRRPRAGCCRRL